LSLDFFVLATRAIPIFLAAIYPRAYNESA